MRTIIDVTRMFQEKIGIRNIVMPGARMQMMVVMKFTAPRMDERPNRYRPNTQKLEPKPGEWRAVDSGV